ncbi:MAG TPA: Rdx family protein [Dehalococcoidia bacterium]|nr:Rdx family protein [Dehalococcoidia bacterium]
MLRATWTAAELLQTFTDSIGEVRLIPGAKGRFEVTIDGELVYSKAQTGVFPDVAFLKDEVRKRLS